MAAVTAAAPLELSPTLLTYKFLGHDVRELLFEWDQDTYLTFLLPREWTYTPTGNGFSLDPRKLSSSISVSTVPVGDLPNTLGTDEDRAYYESLVLRSLPDRAEHSGKVKRAGSFTSDPEATSDSYGLVYSLDGRRFAFAMGFINLKDRESQIRYVLNAQVEDFESLHSEIRTKLGSLVRKTKDQVHDIKTKGYIED